MAEKKLPQGITLRKDGRYQWRFQYAGVSYSGYTHNLTEAKKTLADKKYEVEHGLSGKEKNIILDAWFPEWLSIYKSVECKESTMDLYRNLYRRYIGPEFGKLQMRKLRADNFQRFLNKMAEKYSKTTVSLVRDLLNGCFRQARKCGIVSNNPLDDVTMPKCRQKQKRQAIPADQERAFLEEAKSSSYYSLYRLASLTGMRLGEICGLRWQDVDFEAKLIHIEHTLSFTKEKRYYLDTPKSEMSRRDIPIEDETYKLLRAQRKEQLEHRMIVGEYWEPLEEMDNLVFTTATGKPINRKHVESDKKKIVDRLREKGIEIGDFSFHTLRHCFATRAIEAGMDPKVLQSILGHSTFSMTMDMYVDAMEENKREEMRKISIAL